ncbi:MAG: heat-inducible transcriptional repressor HrcA [Gemmatimonadota bacterium]
MSDERRSTAQTPDPLNERERGVLEAVVRSYVSTAEPAGSRTLARGFELGVSPATIRNTMSDLEEKGYLYHPHTSAGRIPTDRAYRYFVDQIMRPATITSAERERLHTELGTGSTGIESLVRLATRALSLITRELGVAIAPDIDEAVLEKLDLAQVSSSKVLLVATIRGGLVRTVYVDLRIEVPSDTLLTLTVILNERLAGLTLRQIRETLLDRLRGSLDDDPAAEEFLNVFIQSSAELFSLPTSAESSVHIGHTSVLAEQPEFTSSESLKSLIELTEKRDLLADVLTERALGSGLTVTIGREHATLELNDLTLVTAEYRAGNLKGVLGVIGPTRMPYEKVVAIVDYTSSLISRVLTV